MKSEKDIERQLAEAQGAWEANPAPALWDRLEERLDAAQPMAAPRKPGRWPFRIVGVAILLGLGAWCLLPNGNAVMPEGKALAAHGVEWAGPLASAEPSPVPVENGAKLQFGTEDGLAQHPLGAMPNTFSSLRSRGTLADLVQGQRMVLPPPSSNASAQSFSNTSYQQFQYEPLESNGNFAYRPEIDLIQRSLPKGNMLVTNGNGNPIDTVRSLSQFEARNNPTGNSYLQLNVARNDLNFSYANPREARQYDLQHFKWLLGSWKTQGMSGGAIEEWRQKDDFTLVGRGYFVVNGDTIVTQEMRIEQRGPNVYYIIAKDENAKSMRFRLRSSIQNEAVFQDESPKGDKELVLRNNPATREAEQILTTPESRGAQSSQRKGQDLPQAPPGAYKVMRRKDHP